MRKQTTTNSSGSIVFFKEPMEHDSRLQLSNTHKENKSLFTVITYVYLYKNLHILIEYTVLKSNSKITKITYDIDEVHHKCKSLEEVIALADELSH